MSKHDIIDLFEKIDYSRVEEDYIDTDFVVYRFIINKIVVEVKNKRNKTSIFINKGYANMYFDELDLDCFYKEIKYRLYLLTEEYKEKCRISKVQLESDLQRLFFIKKEN